MGEGRQDANQSPTGRRVTVTEAATALGISVEAVRGRIKRGTIEHVREGERVYVLLGQRSSDQSSTSLDQGDDQPTDRPSGGSTDELIGALRDQVEHLKGQLEEANTANRENRRIIAQLTSRIPQLEAPRDEQNQAESAESRSDKVERPPPVPDAAESRSEPRRGWFGRIFGRR